MQIKDTNFLKATHNLRVREDDLGRVVQIKDTNFLKATHNYLGVELFLGFVVQIKDTTEAAARFFESYSKSKEFVVFPNFDFGIIKSLSKHSSSDVSCDVNHRLI